MVSGFCRILCGTESFLKHLLCMESPKITGDEFPYLGPGPGARPVSRISLGSQPVPTQPFVTADGALLMILLTVLGPLTSSARGRQTKQKICSLVFMLSFL